LLLTGYSELNLSFHPSVNFLENNFIESFRTDGIGPEIRALLFVAVIMYTDGFEPPLTEG
jgi:hypothetical protein